MRPLGDHNEIIDSEALPATRQSTRSTRSSSSNAITYIPKRSRTVTYQRSFFIRACRTWNVLPAELRTSHISLASFKCSLLQYYNKALDLHDALTTSEPGEKSVPGVTQRGLYCARRRAASSNLSFCFVSFGFSSLYISSFSYSFFFFNDCFVFVFVFVFFLINEGSTIIGQAVVVSLPNNFYVFMYKDCILDRRS